MVIGDRWCHGLEMLSKMFLNMVFEQNKMSDAQGMQTVYVMNVNEKPYASRKSCNNRAAYSSGRNIYIQIRSLVPHPERGKARDTYILKKRTHLESLYLE
jgi:hypothetical protein